MKTRKLILMNSINNRFSNFASCVYNFFDSGANQGLTLLLVIVFQFPPARTVPQSYFVFCDLDSFEEYWLFCRLSFHLGLSEIFSWSDLGDALLTGLPQMRYVSFWGYHIQRYMMSICHYWWCYLIKKIVFPTLI